MNIKRLLLFILIIIICIISVCIGIYAQYMHRYNDTTDILFGNVLDLEQQKEEKYQELKNDFDTIFTNNLASPVTQSNITKINEEKEIVYTQYDYTDAVTNKYDINVKIPVININSELITEYNKQIEEIFKKKADEIENNSNVYTIYGVEYVAYLNSDILSLVIKATLKEGDKAQRVLIQTYNYSLTKDEEVTLTDMLQLKNISLVQANSKVKKEIKEEAENAIALAELGYTVYTRNINDSMYEIENTYNYFLGQDQYLYLIYAYGNTSYTTETDIVIF